MTRNKFLWLAALVILLGLVAGWFLQSWLSPPAVSPVQSGAATTATKAASRAGFCCTKLGSVCEEVTDPGLCFRGGGKAFNAVQRNCDFYCVNIKL